MRRGIVTVLTGIVLVHAPTTSYAISLGLEDLFTVNEENWFAGGLGPPQQSPPVPPDQMPSGGPNGAGDGYLQVTASGGTGAGSRLVAMNADQWTGNYLAAGVNAISVDLRNLGSSDLTVRFLFENPLGGPPSDIGVTTFGAFLPAASGWMHFLFPIAPAELVPVDPGDNMTALLSNVTLLRIIHSIDAGEADQVAGQLGVDNITATVVPEPSTLLLFGSGLAATMTRRARRGRRVVRIRLGHTAQLAKQPTMEECEEFAPSGSAAALRRPSVEASSEPRSVAP